MFRINYEFMNQMSEQISELCKALSKVQGELHGAVKDSNNPFYKSKYADLQSVWEACRESLCKNGFSVSQVVKTSDGVCVLVSYLLHSSGQWISSEYPLHPVKDDPQGFGSCVTYARRYSLAALVGVYQVDDDAESAMNRNSLQNNKKLQETSDPNKNKHREYYADENKQVSDAQLKRLVAISKENNWSNEDVRLIISNRFKKNTSRLLNQVQYEELCNHIQANPIKELADKVNDFNDDVPLFLGDK